MVPPAFFLCVSLIHSEGFSSGIFKFTHMVRFIFPLVFGPLVLGQGRKGIKEVVTKELLGVKFSIVCVCVFKLLILKIFKHTQRENGKINFCVFIPILIILSLIQTR